MNALDELEPRLRLMVTLILCNREAICQARTGVLELHFKGANVSAHLVQHRVLRTDEQEPTGAA